MSTRNATSPITACVAAVVVLGMWPGATAGREAASHLPRLPADTRGAWQAYTAAVEARRAPACDSGHRALLVPPFASDADQRALLAGAVLVRAAGEAASSALPVVPGARVHHWHGAVFIPHASVPQVVARLRQSPPPQRDVLRASVLARDANGMRVFLRVRHQQLLTVVYDTEHDVRFEPGCSSAATSVSRATRVVEIEAPGTDRERRLSDDEDHDFLWRLQAYWRYREVAGGVVAECESVSLSRDVPFALRLVANPLITRTAEASMRAALLAVREHTRAPRAAQ